MFSQHWLLSLLIYFNSALMNTTRLNLDQLSHAPALLRWDGSGNENRVSRPAPMEFADLDLLHNSFSQKHLKTTHEPRAGPFSAIATPRILAAMTS